MICVMNTIKKTLQLYKLLGYIDDGFGLESRSVYLFRSNVIVDLLQDWAKDKRIDTLVDIGCSSGYITMRIKNIAQNIVAVDVDEVALSRIQGENIKTVQDTLPALAALPLQNADVVIALNTLYYLDKNDTEKSVARIKELLTNEGYFIVDYVPKMKEIKNIISQRFQLVDVLQMPFSLNCRLNPDRLFWLIENRFIFCESLFRALKDQNWNIESDFSEHKDRRLTRVCLKYTWLENLIWMFAPLRIAARMIWANQFLLRLFCLKKQRMDYLWVYKK